MSSNSNISGLRTNINGLDITDPDIDLLSPQPEEDQEEMIVGTEHYISPEMVIEKNCSYAADLWALGVIIFKMLTGEFPFFGKNFD